MKAARLAGQHRWRQLGRRSRRLSLLFASALVALLQTAPGSLAVPADGIDVAPPTRVERFNPDLQVCVPQAIKAGFARQLQPWADQPAPVLEQLRRVQLEMTRATVQRCVSKGLMTPADAAGLERQLGLQDVSAPLPAGAVGAPQGQAPAGKP